jgi:hypothetical protein
MSEAGEKKWETNEWGVSVRNVEDFTRWDWGAVLSPDA